MPERKPPETIGEHLRERRLSLGLTQPEAAARVGVCRVTFANWEIHHAVPAVHMLPAVIAFLGYSPLAPAQSFADRLRRVRHSQRLAQRGFALALGVPFNTLRCWELGLVEPKPSRKALIEARLAALLAGAP